VRTHRLSTGTAARRAVAALVIALMPLHAQAQAGGQSLDVLTLDGQPIDPFHAAPSVRATVFVFTRTDCPIANRFAPTLEQLRREFEPRGVRFSLVYVDPAEPAGAIRAHMSEYGLHAAALRDPRHTLVALSGATITPEAAVYVTGEGPPRLIYRGRIDDRFVDFGLARPQPSKHDLREVLEALLAGRTMMPHTTPAVGCVIADLR
jgi:hypothetical protein